METEALNGFMLMAYKMLEKMNREERRFFAKSIKEAKKFLDLNYPEGKPEEKKSDLILPTGDESVKILGTNA